MVEPLKLGTYLVEETILVTASLVAARGADADGEGRVARSESFDARRYGKGSAQKALLEGDHG